MSICWHHHPPPRKKSFRCIVRTWNISPSLARTSSILLYAPLSKCKHSGKTNRVHKKDKMHVSYKEINMVEQSSTVPSHHSIRIHKPFLGLEIINPLSRNLPDYYYYYISDLALITLTFWQLSESKNIKIIFLKLEF